MSRIEPSEGVRSNNFRASLINKCIGDTGLMEGDGDSLQVLQTKGDVDMSKLRTYTWTHVIPHSHRVQTYLYLLGISSSYTEPRDAIDKHREEEAYVLLRCLRTLLTYNGTVEEGNFNPSEWDIVQMILLARRELDMKLIPYKEEDFQKDGHIQAMYAIVRNVAKLSSHNWVNMFHISRELVKIVLEVLDKDTMDTTVAEIREAVERELGMETEEFRAFMKDFPVEIWLRSACCQILHNEKAVFKVLDKVCTKITFVPLLRNVIVNYIIQIDIFQRKASLQKAKKNSLSDDEENKLVHKAIDAALKEKASSRGHQKSSNAGLADTSNSSSYNNLNAVY